MRHLLKHFVFVAITSICGTAFAADKAAVESANAVYQKAGKEILEMVVNKKVVLSEVSKKVDVLVSNGVSLAKEYQKAFPAGDKLLGMVLGSVDKMKAMPFEELEKDWHDLGYFAKPGNDPGVNLKEEDNEHLTDPIHTIVHPLLVLRAAEAFGKSNADAELQVMKEEMEEGLEQCAKMKDVLLTK